MLSFLGRGSAFSSIHNSAYWIDNGSLYLLDCPITSYNQIIKAPLNDMGITHIYILVTHTHSDHIGGISLLIDYAQFISHIPVTVIAPSKEVQDNLIYFIETLDGCDNSWYEIVLFEEAKVNLKCLINAIPTSHAPGLDGRCFGYELCISNNQIIYTGDTNTLSPFIGLIKENAYLYIEMSSVNSPVHLFIDEQLPILNKLSEEGKHIYLMHLDDEAKIESAISNTSIKIAPIKPL